jgi:transposase
MAIELPDARHMSDEVLEALRLRALHACELGFSEGDVAEVLGVARETVSRWWSAYQSGGLDALPQDRNGRPVGSGRTLTDEQASHLQDLIDHYQPEQLEIAAPLWNRGAVRDLIRKEYNIAMPVRTVGEYLKRWGYTCKRPQRHSRDQDPEEVRRWLEETYPALEKRAREEDAEILWGDETGVAADEHPGYGYAREGQPAIVEVPDSHIRQNMISAISNEGAVRFMTFSGGMNEELFLEFLRRLVRPAAGKIFLIVDNLRAHDSKMVKAWRAQHQDQIEVFFLPSHSPEMNPDEYLNNDLKANVNQQGLPENKQTLRTRIQGFMRELGRLPEHVVNYFSHPAIQYAATEL